MARELGWLDWETRGKHLEEDVLTAGVGWVSAWQREERLSI